MKISEIYKDGHPTLSFEVFPPKTIDVYDSVVKATNEVAALHLGVDITHVQTSLETPAHLCV